jgi:serine/threonine protein kinase
MAAFDSTSNHPICDPEPFPNPVIRRSVVRRVPVRLSDSQTERRPVVESASGHVYEIGSTLKKAIFGQVIHGILLHREEGDDVYIRSCQEVAIKIYSKRTLRTLQGRVQENPLMEITAMQFIGSHHPNIMGQLECCTDEENIYSIMCYCHGGELFDYIDEHGPMKNKQAKHMFYQLLNGLAYLHSLGIGHRDMSLENILVDDKRVYIIIDFGMCLRLKFDPASRQYCSISKQPICGKKNYIAPEVLREDKQFNPLLCDIWALGIILFIAITGVPPVDKASPADERYNMICSNQLHDMLTTWGISVNPLAVDLIQRVLRPNPEDRLTIDMMLHHPWMLEKDEEDMEE